MAGVLYLACRAAIPLAAWTNGTMTFPEHVRAGRRRAVEGDAADEEVAGSVPVEERVAGGGVHAEERRSTAGRARIARVAR